MYALPISIVALFCGRLSAQEELDSVDEIVERVAAEHVEQPDLAELQRAALEGVLLWLERHEGAEQLAVISRDQYLRFQRHAEGERFGVGIGVLLVPGYGIRILEVFPGTPAAHAQLQPGDIVVAVNGEAIRDRDPVAAARLLAAEGRAQIVLEILDQQGNPRSVTLVPEPYRAPPVAVSDGEGYRILRVHHFGRGAAEAVWQALTGDASTRDLILDLRDVRDGLLEEVVAAAAPFLGGERVACFAGDPEGGSRPVPVPAVGLWTRPIVLLINGGTEGLAELFAAMIQRVNRQATLVGTPTAGVDALPTWVSLGPDRVLQLAGTRLTLADGTSWARVGVVPDVVVQAAEGPQVVPPPAAPADLQVDAALRLVDSPE